MATDSPILYRQRVFGAKVEATTGTAESITNSEGAFNIFNAKMDEESKADEREGQGTLSPLTGSPGAMKGTLEFDTEMVGDGSGTSPSWGIFLRAAGMNFSTDTWTPYSNNPTTLTAKLYQLESGGANARIKTVAGAMLDCTIKGKAGERVMMHFKGEGCWAVPTRGAPITPAYPQIVAPTLKGATFTIGGSAYPIPDFEIAFNNVLQLRMNPNSASGYHAAVIGRRRYTLKISPEALPLSTEDWYAAFQAQTAFALNCVIGSNAHNTFTITAPKMTLAQNPKDVQQGDILADSLEFLMTRNASAGDDEFKIVAS